MVRAGDRFRVVRDVDAHVQLAGYAPAHTSGVDCVVPAGTVIVAHDQVPGATAFGCYPEDYDRMEAVLIPEEQRESFTYAGSYGLTFKVSDIGDLLQPLAPLERRPPNQLPRVSGRPSAHQRAERARHDALMVKVDEVEYARITQVTDQAWVRRNRGRKGAWEVPGPDGKQVPLPSWDLWFVEPPGDPPRPPDDVQPGGSFAVANRIWGHHEGAKSTG